MGGRFFAVVGPSGVGKDSVMDGLCAAMPGLVRARRVVTRPHQAGGEDHEAVDEAVFRARAARGDFLLSCRPTGFATAFRAPYSGTLKLEATCWRISRAILPVAAKALPRFAILSISARPDILAQRLSARGRESAEDRAARLERASLVLPQGLPPHVQVFAIDNSGALADAVAAALDALQPASA